MYSRFRLATKYLFYYFNALNGKGHGTHSPFVFHFITKILNDHENYPEYGQIEDLRGQLLDDATLLTVEDHGAGSTTTATKQRSISSIARSALKTKKYGQLLFRMVRNYKPKTILELGTSLGITTAYFSVAAPASRVVTIEGAPAIASVAARNFNLLGLTNIELIEGTFDEKLPTVLNSTIDLAFIDGNHRKEPTLNYFEQILPKTHNDSILIFDDIHWSAEMEEAWNQIKQHPSVKCSIDLFFLGIVIFRNEFKEKQEFTIKF